MSWTRWTSRALVAAAGGLLVLGAAFGAGGVGTASADDSPPATAPATTAAPEGPGTLPPESPTSPSPEPAITAAPGRGKLPPLGAEPAPGVPNGG